MNEVKKGKAAHVYSVNLDNLREAIVAALNHKDELSPNIRGSLEYLKKVFEREESVRKAREANAKQ